MTIRNYNYYFIALIGCLLLTNAWLAITLPLTADEAHYALYAKYLDWSYFDHPPMVGWLQSITLQFGESNVLLRILPWLLGGTIYVTLWLITKHWYNERQAIIVAFIFITSPLAKLLTIIWLPELPLLMSGIGVLFFTRRALIADKFRDYIGLGICLGLAGLSKYTAVTLAVSVIGIFYFEGSLRRLFMPKMWLTGMVAAFMITPILYWNWSHDWVSFSYQINHGTGNEKTDWMNVLRMQLGQLIAYGPFIYGLLWLVLISPISRRTQEDRILLWFSVPILALFSLAALKGRTLPHWTLLGIVFLLPLIAKEAHLRWSGIKFKWYSGIAGAMTLGIWIAVHSILVGWNPGFKDFSHPLKDFIGWSEAAEEARNLADKTGIDTIAIPNWSNASRVSWYARPNKVVVLDDRYDQFDLWFGTLSKGESAVLILSASELNGKTQYVSQFNNCTKANYVEFRDGPTLVNTFTSFICTDYKI